MAMDSNVKVHTQWGLIEQPLSSPPFARNTPDYPSDDFTRTRGKSQDICSNCLLLIAFMITQF